MRALISIYDPTGNFWDLNPKFKTLDMFAELYRKDKSKKKASSSLQMWVVCSFLEKESPYASIEENVEDRNGQSRIISRDLTEDDNWWAESEEMLLPYRERYQFFLYTAARRSLVNWENKLMERDRVLADTSYEIGLTDENGKLVGSNVAILDKMLVDTGKVWDQFFKIKEVVEGEGAGTSIKGDGQASLSDTGQV